MSHYIDEDKHPLVPPGHPSFMLGAEINAREPKRLGGAHFSEDRWYFVHRYPYPYHLATQEERESHDSIFMIAGAEGDDRLEASAVAQCWWQSPERSPRRRAKEIAAQWAEWGAK